MSVAGVEVRPGGERSLFEAVLEDFLLLLLLEGSLVALPLLEPASHVFPRLDEEDLSLGDLEVSCGVVWVLLDEEALPEGLLPFCLGEGEVKSNRFIFAGRQRVDDRFDLAKGKSRIKNCFLLPLDSNSIIVYTLGCTCWRVVVG